MSELLTYGSVGGGGSDPAPYPAATHAFSMTDYVMADLGTLGGLNSHAFAINERGTIVGDSDAAGGARHAFSYSDGVMTDLAPYLTSVGLTGNSSAQAINDNGWIVGYAGTATGPAHAFLLTPIPEPGSLALLALGGAAALLRRRAR